MHLTVQAIDDQVDQLAQGVTKTLGSIWGGARGAWQVCFQILTPNLHLSKDLGLRTRTCQRSDLQAAIQQQLVCSRSKPWR